MEGGSEMCGRQFIRPCVFVSLLGERGENGRREMCTLSPDSMGTEGAGGG